MPQLTVDLKSLAARTLESDPDQVAIRFEDRSLTYAELDALVDRHAAALAERGIEAGDRVALMAYNRPDLVALFFACWRIGAIAVPVNVLYRRPEVEYAVGHCGSRLLIVQEELAEAAAGLASDLPSLDGVFGLHGIADGFDGSWEEIVATAEGRPPDVELGPDTPAMILYTSGSTSRPKGVTHTHGSIASTARTRVESMSNSEDDVWLIGTGMVHVSGSFGTLFPALHAGATAVLMESFTPAGWLAEARRHRPTRGLLLPAMMLDVLDHPDAPGTDLSSFRSLEVGGDALTHDHYHRWGQLSSAPLCQVLGMTECEGYCLTRPEGPIIQGSVGPPRLGVEVRVIDHNGRSVPPGEVGELTLRSASMTIGYWEDEEHTEAGFRDGWLLTSDLGRIDEDGFVWFVGRSSEMIVRGGANIAPGEVEDLLEEHPDVFEAVVVGVADKRLGQRVACFVEPEPGRLLDEDELRKWASERIAEIKVPGYWCVLDALPRNPVGKLDRAEIHRRANAAQASDAD